MSTKITVFAVKQVETDRRLILCQLTERKYGKVASDVLSPSSSCPINLDSLLKRDYSTESQATKSSGADYLIAEAE